MHVSASSLRCYHRFDADNSTVLRLGDCEEQPGFEGSTFCGVMKDPALKSDSTEKSCVTIDQIELLASLGPDIWSGGLKAAEGCYEHKDGNTWICLEHEYA